MPVHPAQPLAQALSRLTTYLSQDCLGGPRPVTLATVINVQKGGTALFVLGLMAGYSNWTGPAFVYLALHGTYGSAGCSSTRPSATGAGTSGSPPAAP